MAQRWRTNSTADCSLIHAVTSQQHSMQRRHINLLIKVSVEPPYLGSQHDATRSLSSGAWRYRSVGGTRRRQPSVDICCTRPSSAANLPHVAATVDRRDRQTDGRTDGHPTVKQTLHRELCGQRQQHSTAPHYTPQAAEVDYGRAAGTTSSAAAAAAVRSKWRHISCRCC